MKNARGGSLMLIVLGIMAVVGILAVTFSRLSREAQSDALRFLRREVIDQFLSSALDEGFLEVSRRTDLAGTPEFLWVTDAARRVQPISLSIPLTLSESGFLAQENSRLRPEEVRVTAQIIDFKTTDSRQRSYSSGEGVGTLALAARCRLGQETWVCTRTHDVKISSLISSHPQARGMGYNPGGVLDCTLLVRNGINELSGSPGSANPSAVQFQVKFPAEASRERCGNVLVGGGANGSLLGFPGLPGREESWSQGLAEALDVATSSFFGPDGQRVWDISTVGEPAVQPFRFVNLHSRRVAVSASKPEDAARMLSEALQECGVFEAQQGVLHVRGIVSLQGGPLELTHPSQEIKIRGRGVILADSIAINAGLICSDKSATGDTLILVARNGPITIGTSKPIEAFLAALSKTPGLPGRLVIKPGCRLDLRGGLAVDELGLAAWPPAAAHLITDDCRFRRSPQEGPLLAVSLSRGVTWQQTVLE